MSVHSGFGATAKEFREQFFTPGNIVKSYAGYDLVHEFRNISNEGRWCVLVSEVKQTDEGAWNEVGRKRWHSTEPDLSYQVIAVTPSLNSATNN